MQQFKLLFAILCLGLVTAASYASPNNNLTLFLSNYSTETLSFVGIKGQNPGNTFNMVPQVMVPGQTAVITGNTSFGIDLVAFLEFKDSSGNENNFLVIDYRQSKVGQPVFAFLEDNKILSSVTTSKTFNKQINAQALTFTSASVMIRNKK